MAILDRDLGVVVRVRESQHHGMVQRSSGIRMNSGKGANCKHQMSMTIIHLHKALEKFGQRLNWINVEATIKRGTDLRDNSLDLFASRHCREEVLEANVWNGWYVRRN